jgi:hypothetical protein
LKALIKSMLVTWLYSLCILTTPLVLAAQQAADGSITISKQDCLDPPPEAQLSHNTLNLDCKTYHQTTNYTCGPAALMTLMLYYRRLTPEDMNPKTELHIALEMGATETGTTLPQMINWLSNHGFNVETGERIQSDVIINNLKQNTPTIITVHHHWILAKGYQQASASSPETISFSDSCCGITVLTSAEIDALWEEAETAKLHGDECTDEGQYIVARFK